MSISFHWKEYSILYNISHFKKITCYIFKKDKVVRGDVEIYWLSPHIFSYQLDTTYCSQWL